MIDDSPKSQPPHLSEADASFLASLLMGEPAKGPIVDVSRDGGALIDLTDNPTLTFDPSNGMAEMLSGAGSGKVSDLVDVALVLATRPSEAIIARSVFGQPEPTGLALGSTASRARASGTAVGASHGTSHGWFHPVGETAAAGAAVASEDLFNTKTRPDPPVTVRLDSAASKNAGDAVVFTAAGAKDSRRRKVMLAALFFGAVAIGGGLVAILTDRSLVGSSSDATVPPVEVVTTLEPAPTTAAPTTAAPTTAAPTTAAPTTATTLPPTTATPTTVAPTTAAPTTAAPTTATPTTRPPTTRAPRTTRRPATTQPPATSPPTTSAPTVTFAPPTWADPLEE